MDDAVAVALEPGPEVVGALGVAAAARVPAPHAVGSEGGPLGLFEVLPAPHEAVAPTRGSLPLRRPPLKPTGTRRPRLRRTRRRTRPDGDQDEGERSAPFADPAAVRRDPGQRRQRRVREPYECLVDAGGDALSVREPEREEKRLRVREPHADADQRRRREASRPDGEATSSAAEAREEQADRNDEARGPSPRAAASSAASRT